MDTSYNLSNLKDIFRASIARGESTIAFEITNGRGQFVFFMFFDNKDFKTRDLLWIYLRNTNQMLHFKMYGNHYNKGDFVIYPTRYDKQKIMAELDLGTNITGNRFNFDSFFNEINNSIPQTLPSKKTMKVIRENWKAVKKELPKQVVDEHDKTILIGPKRLPDGHSPREQTLRKLYIYTNANYEDIKTLIDMLKKTGQTVAWTNNKDRLKNAKTVTDIIQM